MRGGYAMDTIKVLWMNNGDSKSKFYIDNAKLEGIEITTCGNMEECRRELSHHNHKRWETILLDACPIMTANLLPNSHEIGTAYKQVFKYDIPIFIVACENEMNLLEENVAKSFAGKNRFFYLHSSEKVLYKEIRNVVSENEDYQIRKRYGTIYDFYCSELDTSDELLMNLLKGLMDDKLYNNHIIPGVVRLILDKIMLFLNNEGILPVKFTGANLGACSKWLGDEKGVIGNAKDIVPIHVQRCFHSCVTIANNGDHQIPKESAKEYEARISNPLYVQKQIGENAPYLNKALIYDLLNIIYWCASLDEKTFEL